MARGQAIGCFGLTEPDHGSDPGGMETRARRDGDGWVISGTKRWITNGSISDVAVVWAKVGDVIRGFLVERGTPGFSTRDIKGKFSLRASITSELVLEDVRPRAGVGGVPGGERARWAVLVPQPGALRDRVGRARRGALLLPDGAPLRPGPEAVRPPHRRLPARRSSSRSWSTC
jgi:glutaryl-CoA dehydrogenase